MRSHDNIMASNGQQQSDSLTRCRKADKLNYTQSGHPPPHDSNTGNRQGQLPRLCPKAQNTPNWAHPTTTTTKIDAREPSERVQVGHPLRPQHFLLALEIVLRQLGRSTCTVARRAPRVSRAGERGRADGGRLVIGHPGWRWRR